MVINLGPTRNEGYDGFLSYPLQSNLGKTYSLVLTVLGSKARAHPSGTLLLIEQTVSQINYMFPFRHKAAAC